LNSPEAYAAVLRKAGAASVDGTSHAEKPDDAKKKFATFAFGAHFAEVHVDAELGQVRVTRFVGAFASGRILNAQTARSQYMGGIVWGIGNALTEITRTDLRSGRIMTANLAEYLVPVNADVPAIDIVIVPEDDPNINPIGTKGIGEIGIVGAAAAIANAVYHATGVRVRELPIAPDKLLT
jgi:xanthine dehydrogenase YagR molybdenum-binding subunit